MEALEKFRGKCFNGAAELTSAAIQLASSIDEAGGRTEMQTGLARRLVQQYIAENLVGAPAGHAGGEPVYNYANLLRLLAAKRLLGARWSILKTRELIASMSLQGLEQLISGHPTRSGRGRLPEGVETGNGRREKSGTSLGRGRHAEPPSRDLATHHASSMRSISAPQSEMSRDGAGQDETTPIATVVGEWIELAPGLEIRVRRGFRPPGTLQETERLAARFWSVVDRQKPRREETE